MGLVGSQLSLGKSEGWGTRQPRYDVEVILASCSELASSAVGVPYR